MSMNKKIISFTNVWAPLLGAGAVGVCPLCWAGSAALLSYTGLVSLIPLWQWLVVLLLGAGLVGFAFDYKAHKNWRPIAIFILGSAALYFGRYIFAQAPVWVGGALLIIGAIVYNKRQFQKPALDKGDEETDVVPKPSSDMNTATLTCPKCGEQQHIAIPNDKCLTAHVCSACKATITVPKDSANCCVVCEYSDKQCPVADMSNR